MEQAMGIEPNAHRVWMNLKDSNFTQNHNASVSAVRGADLSYGSAL